ncbi:Cobaltochelatase [Sulfitobacter noctilucicola]|nr:Cobaltochelatase [Sulfitobacter noctilucicola]
MADTGAGRTAFAASLKHLIDLGMLERNPGHGHPLRPEYRLTAIGEKAAAMADRIKAIAPETSLLRRSWTVPVLAVSGTPKHYSQVKGALGPITDRALSQSLKQLHDARWIEREINTHTTPPRVSYCAVGPGRQIYRAAGLEAQG